MGVDWNKITGYFLIITTIFFTLFLNISLISWINNLERIFLSMFLLVFGFFVGKFYIDMENNKYKSNKLTKFSAIFVWVGSLITILSLILLQPLNRGDPTGTAIQLFLTTILIGISYGLALILLIIHWKINIKK